MQYEKTALQQWIITRQADFPLLHFLVRIAYGAIFYMNNTHEIPVWGVLLLNPPADFPAAGQAFSQGSLL